MDTKSKIFFWILVIAVLISILLTYRRSFITKDYEVIEGDVSAPVEEVQ